MALSLPWPPERSHSTQGISPHSICKLLYSKDSLSLPTRHTPDAGYHHHYHHSQYQLQRLPIRTDAGSQLLCYEQSDGMGCIHRKTPIITAGSGSTRHWVPWMPCEGLTSATTSAQMRLFIFGLPVCDLCEVPGERVDTRTVFRSSRRGFLLGPRYTGIILCVLAAGQQCHVGLEEEEEQQQQQQ